MIWKKKIDKIRKTAKGGGEEMEGLKKMDIDMDNSVVIAGRRWVKGD